MKKNVIILMICLASFVNQMNSQSENYIVLSSIDNITDDYFHAVFAISDYRDAEIVYFDPENVDEILPELINIAPRYVAVVCKPEELHINFIREFLMMSTMLDDDPFSDFSYGFITGATADDALNFVYSIIQAESENIEDFPLNVGGYSATTLNLVYTGSSGYMSYLNPASSSEIWLETNDNGSGEDFFIENSSYMENNKILDIGHNGDAHMLWLFEGGNTDPNPPSWIYDPDKIENPAYAREGLTSFTIGALNLYPAVAFNGACHSGETKSVMVEGDIEATFGYTEGLIKFYTMSDTFSFALSILKTGITGYFAPCGANNANDQGEDVYNAFLYNEPLGDIHKRSNDGVVMGFLGNKPALRIFEENESVYLSDVLPSGTFDPDEYSGAKYMLGGKANRIYFGDPLFNPYQNNHSESLNITQASIDSINPTTLDIDINFNKPDGFWPVWDKFHSGETRVYYPVELPSYCNDLTNFEVIESSGPYDLVIHALEYFDGKTILHIEVDIPDDMYDPIDYHIKFRINYTNTVNTTQEQISKNVLVFPNPSSEITNFYFSNLNNEEFTMIIYDCSGRMINKINNIYGNRIEMDNYDKQNGLYFYELVSKSGISEKGKFIIEH
ncbi:MAG TPA: T9SS type A sorting domain-containing protein [Bacteroidales bacterium]|nr:T9SS type A sorting domain-containing protein [Bacteroidales bacterium]